jgi:hypothetical protein
MVDFLQQYWLLIAVIFIAIGVGIYIIVKEPKKVQEWLVWACAQAELTLGSGTGMLKLREVYDMFLTQYPMLSKFIAFTTFQKWTEEALLIFKDWVANNIVQTLFPGDGNEENKG